MSKRPEIHDPILGLALLPLFAWSEVFKSLWRAKRNQERRDMGLPTLDEKETPE